MSGTFMFDVEKMSFLKAGPLKIIYFTGLIFFVFARL